MARVNGLVAHSSFGAGSSGSEHRSSGAAQGFQVAIVGRILLDIFGYSLGN